MLVYVMLLHITLLYVILFRLCYCTLCYCKLCYSTLCYGTLFYCTLSCCMLYYSILVTLNYVAVCYVTVYYVWHFLARYWKIFSHLFAFLTLDHLCNTVVECAPSIHTDIYRTLGCPSCSTDVQMLQVSKQVKISASSITVVSF